MHVFCCGWKWWDMIEPCHTIAGCYPNIYIYIYVQKGTLSGSHFSTFLEMQCFCYIMFNPLCSYTCDGIARDPHRLSDFLRGCQRMSRESWRFPDSQGKGRRNNKHSVYIYIYLPLGGEVAKKKKKHIFVWDSCFWFCIPPSVRRPPPVVRLHTFHFHTTCHHTTCPHTTYSHTTCSHTTCPHTTCPHTQLAHTPLVHTQLVHTQLTHTQLTHNLSTHNLLTHNLFTHNLSTHNLSTHNLLTHNLSTHNLSTHNLLTHNLLTHNLSTHNLSTHNLLTHNLLTQNLHILHPPSLCVAGVARRRGTWWFAHTQLAHTHLVHTQLTHMSTYSHTTYTSCIHRHFAWQTWHRRGWHLAWRARHLVTSTFTLRGRRGTWSHPPSLCVAGKALGHIDLHFAWQAWQAWHLVTSTFFAWQACHLATWTFILRGRCGTWWHPPSLCVAGVALGDMDLHFAWQAWHLVTSTFTLCGRRGTYGTGLALVARLVPVWRRGRRGCLCGRRGTWRHGPSLCAAGVALGDIHRHFAWQAWHLWHWAGSGGALGSCLAPWAPRLFAWQAWYLDTSTSTLRGRRGTYGIGLAGVALGDM